MSFDEREGREERRRRERREQKLVFDVGDVKEALALASKQWGVPEGDLRANVLSSERGFLGLGLFGSKLKVEVTPARPLALLKGVSFLDELLGLMGMEAKASLLDDGALDIGGPDAAERIAGRYGDCLKAMEYLLNLALRDPAEEPRVRLDSSGYRERRTRSLERLAEATARQALEYGRPIRLDPMLSWERWIIHMALKDRADIRTESIGEPPMRKVVVMPRYGDSGMDGGGYRSRPRSPRPRLPRRGRRY